MTGTVMLPVSYRSAGVHDLVVLVNPDTVDFSAGFLSYGLPEAAEHQAIEPLEQWLARVEQPGRTFSNVSAIFHVSRCGSTLLSQNIKRASSAIVLSEPNITALMRSDLAKPYDREIALRCCLAAIGAWSDWAEAQGKRLVIKFNSQINWKRRGLTDTMTGAQFVFLHRDPLPVLESIHRGKPAFLNTIRGTGPFPYCDGLEDIEDMQLLKSATAGYCSALEAFSSWDDDRILPVAFSDLPGRFAEICRHLRLEPVTNDAWDAKMNAKQRKGDKNDKYSPVSAESLAEFARNHPGLLDLASRHYARFLSVAATQFERP